MYNIDRSRDIFSDDVSISVVLATRLSYTRTFEEPIPDSACKRHAVSRSGIRSVSEPDVVVIEPSEQPRLALLQGLLPTPYVDQGMRLVVVETVVRTTVERHQQQGPRLFGTNDRQQALNHPEHLLEMLAVAQNGIGRQQQGIQFATHHVAFELQAAVLLQHLRGQRPILRRHPLRRVVAPEGLMKPRRNAVAVQPRVDVAVIGIQRNNLILPGLDESSGTYMQFSTQTITSLRPVPGWMMTVASTPLNCPSVMRMRSPFISRSGPGV